MPVTPTYPGVYIEEVPSGVHTITGVATSITAFVGYTARGLDNRATRIFNFGDFERAFGGLAPDSELSYAVRHFFDNGGTEAFVVRAPAGDAVAASVTILDGLTGTPKQALTVTALSRGAWGNDLIVDVDYAGIPAANTDEYNLTITNRATNVSERFARVSQDATKPNEVVAVVSDADSGSELVAVSVPNNKAGRPVESGTSGGDVTLSGLKNDNTYTVKASSDVPAGKLADVVVNVIDKDETIPTSILGLCRLLERKLNLAFGAVLPGAAVRCVPSASGGGVRVIADFSRDLQPGTDDAKITFAAGATNSALSMLGLTSAQTSASAGHYVLGTGRTASGLAQAAPVKGAEGTTLPKTADLIGSRAAFSGIYALEKVDLFNLLCIPDATRAARGDPTTLDSVVSPNDVFTAAAAYCAERRAFLLVDPPPEVDDVDAAADWKSDPVNGLNVVEKNAAAFFPRLRLADPLNDFAPRTFAPCGVVAGVYARTDAERGVWKAPAGVEATLRGVQTPVYRLSDAENGVLNPLGLNCARTFPVIGNVLWGARTLVGADVLASEWKYVPVRRLALYIEETLYRGTKWVVFEPNDESLWAQIRLNVGAFMQTLFRQGAFQGRSAREAYLVKCDRETTTQADVDRGVVNVLVGFAPLKPAEFVIIRIQQLAGQLQV